MKLLLYRNLWGIPGPRAAAVARIAAAGYDGVEAVLFTPQDHAPLRRALRGQKLEFKAALWLEGRSAADHLRSLRTKVQAALRLEPGTISVIGGNDTWDDDETARYFEGALRLEAATGRPFAHETHRGSALFHPGPARRALARFPELKLVCDFSHWVLTSERLLDDQLATIRLCGRHAVHLHARVGTEQSPQVPDVRAPAARRYRAAFERWWEIVWDEQAKRGLPVTSLCPELGPPPYQVAPAGTPDPAADLWAQCEWQKRRQLRRFNRWRLAAGAGRAPGC
jgi:hypothetical protein